MKFFATIFAAFFICLGVKAQDDGRFDVSYRFYNGVMLYSLGELNDAAAVFAYNIESSPCHAPSLFYMAKITYDLSKESDDIADFSNALVFVEQAIEADSTELDFQVLLGQIYVSMGQYAQAQRVVDSLIGRTNDPRHQTLNAALLFEMGDYKKSITQCDAYELRYGLEQDVSEIKYLAMMRERDYFGLEEYLGRVAIEFPLNTNFLIALAEINTTMRHDSTAVAHYKQAIAIDSTQSEGYIALARYYQYKEDTPNYIATLLPYFKLKDADSGEKVAIFERDFFAPSLYRDHYAAIGYLASALLFSAPDDIDVAMLYGRFLTYTGQIDAAFDFYQSIQPQSTKSEELYSRIGAILMYRKDFQGADSLFAQGTLHYPQSITLTQNLLAAKWLGGDIAEALKLTDKAIKGFKSDSIRSTLYTFKGDIYHELGDERRCYSAYDKALKFDATNSGVLNNYAYFLALSGRHLERALAMATLACELSTANPTFLDTKAWVLFTMGRYNDALQIQQAALGLDTDKSPELLLHYGDILYANGDDFLARTYWKRALEAGADKGVIEQRLTRPKAINSR